MIYNKKYIINYTGGSSGSENKELKVGDILIVIVTKYIGDKNNMEIIQIDSNEIYDENDNKINGYQDYYIGIVPGDGSFMKKDYSLKVDGYRHKRCNGCTTWIKKKEKQYVKSNTQITEKPFFPEEQDSFKLCKNKDKDSDIYDLVPIKLVGEITAIDTKKKYMDLSIHKYYVLTNTC